MRYLHTMKVLLCSTNRLGLKLCVMRLFYRLCKSFPALYYDGFQPCSDVRFCFWHEIHGVSNGIGIYCCLHRLQLSLDRSFPLYSRTP
jgi:hypothetical protein